MQIHYLWVKDFGHLKDAGINLSSRFLFKMSTKISGRKKTHTLSIKNNEAFIPNFFEKDNVTNVTAIIGKNGAGKSSILKYIKSHLPYGLSSNVQDDVIAYSVLEDDDRTFYVLVPDDIDLRIDDQTELFKHQPYGNIEGQSLRFSGNLDAADYIYYSYFLDYDNVITDWGGLLNISTSALLSSQRNRLLQENLHRDHVYELLTKNSDLQNLVLDEVARSIQFFNSEDSKRLPFKRPQKLLIEFNLDDSLYFKTNSSNQDVHDLLERLFQRNDWENPKEGVLNNFLLSIFINFLIDERKYSNNNPIKAEVPPYNGTPLREFILNFFLHLGGIKMEFEGQQVPVKKYNDLAEGVPVFYNLLKKLLFTDTLVPIGDKCDGVSLSLDKSTDEIFSEIIRQYLLVKGISTFFNFRWGSLSTGEQSYLSLMSRFYHLKHHEHYDLKHNLVILIDEGDACYHPEWQRKYFNTTLDYLSRLFSEHSIQLIFTANTPFLSSDLPKSNVLFIEKSEKGVSIYHSKDNDRNDTFAANIHTLYSDSFYLNGVLIGDFAKNRIDKIIAYLNDEKQVEPNLKYKMTIDMIGEPVLKMKLKDMWNEKFGLEEELLQLNKRIQEIKELQQENITKKKNGKDDQM